MIRRILFCFFFFAITTGFGQLYPQIGARSMGIGNTGLTFTDVYSAYNNPGAFGALAQTEVGISYENRFLLKDLSNQSLAFGYHSKNAGNFGLQFQQVGFSLYREMQGGLVYGRKLSNRFYGGVGVQFHRIQLAENYGGRTAASASLGILYEANENLSFGARVQNLSRTSLADFEDERLPTRFAIGGTYIFSEKALWNLEVEKAVIHPVNIKSGLEIHAHEILDLRFGVNSYPFQSSFGLGLNFENLTFDIATQWHSVLGISPAGGLKYTFN